MKNTRTMLISLTAAALFTGCISKSDADNARRTDVNQLLELFNADLGEEGVPVERRELREILNNDPALLDAVQSDLSDGLGDLIPGMTELTEVGVGDESIE